MADDAVDPTYADIADIQRHLQSNFNFDDQTQPDKEAVESFILEAEAQVERETGHAWQLKTVTDEYYDIPEFIATDRLRFVKIKLRHRKIRTFDNAEGDKIEVWNGNEYVDYLTEKNEGRGPNGYWWVDYDKGFLYLRLWQYTDRESALRMSYRWGESSVPFEVRKATSLLAASLLISNDDKVQLVSDTGNEKLTTHKEKADYWRKEAYAIMENLREIEVL